MPFDIVWLDNMNILGDNDQSRSLSFKNLIGRAGRLSSSPKFDFGYVFTKNPKLLAQRVNDKFLLSEESIIDSEDIDQDKVELIDSIKDGSFDDDKQAPPSKIERLRSPETINYCESILNIIYGEASIKDALYGSRNKQKRRSLEVFFVLYMKPISTEYCTMENRQFSGKQSQFSCKSFKDAHLEKL